jgi:hypothetical protein
MINCTNVVELRNIGECMYEARCKCKSNIRKIQVGTGKGGLGF